MAGDVCCPDCFFVWFWPYSFRSTCGKMGKGGNVHIARTDEHEVREVPPLPVDLEVDSLVTRITPRTQFANPHDPVEGVFCLVFREIFFPFLFSGLARVICTIVWCLVPYLLSEFIKRLQPLSTPGRLSTLEHYRSILPPHLSPPEASSLFRGNNWEGWIWLVALGVSQLTFLLSRQVSFYFGSKAGIRAKSVIQDMIYSRLLSMPPKVFSSNGFSQGSVQSLLSSDTDAIRVGVEAFHRVWNWIPIFGFSMILLFNLLGIAMLPSLILILILIILKFILGFLDGPCVKHRARVTDERVASMCEVISSVEVLKSNNWTKRYFGKIMDWIDSENKFTLAFRAIRVSGMVDAIVFWGEAVAVLGAFLINGYIDPVSIYTASMCIVLTNLQILSAWRASQALAAFGTSFGRIRKFLEATIPEDQRGRIGYGIYNEDVDEEEEEEELAFEIKNGHFEWENESEIDSESLSIEAVVKNVISSPVSIDMEEVSQLGETPAISMSGNDESLREFADRMSMDALENEDLMCEPFSSLEDINIRIPQGGLTLVIGKVGSGKSSLLHALLGEMPLVSADRFSTPIQNRDEIAFCAQQPWIRGGTIRDNILFGLPFHAAKLARVTSTCCLDSDLKELEGGLDCVVCENGANLSGGQRARVALCRACYRLSASRNPTFVFDDVLGAVDPAIASSLFQNCLCGLLKGTTRVIALHQLCFLGAADYVILMDRGRVAESGSLEEILGRGRGDSTVAKLIMSRIPQALLESDVGFLDQLEDIDDDEDIEEEMKDHIARRRMSRSVDASMIRRIVRSRGSNRGVKSFRTRRGSLSDRQRERQKRLRRIADSLRGGPERARHILKLLATSTISTNEKTESVEQDPEEEIDVSEEEEQEEGTIPKKLEEPPRKHVLCEYLCAHRCSAFTVAIWILVLFLSVGLVRASAWWLSQWIAGTYTAKDGKAFEAAYVFNNISESILYSFNSSLSCPLNGSEAGLTCESETVLVDWSPLYSDGTTVQNGLSHSLCAVIYISLILGGFLLSAARECMGQLVFMWISTLIHKKALRKLADAPMAFFHKVSFGEILSRFTADVGGIMFVLPEFIPMVLFECTEVIILTILISIATNGFAALIILPSWVLYTLYFVLFRNVSNDADDFYVATKGPLMLHIAETIEGLSTIRAFRHQSGFKNQFRRHVDSNARGSFGVMAAGRWVETNLAFISAAIQTSITVLIIAFTYFAPKDSSWAPPPTAMPVAVVSGFILSFFLPYVVAELKFVETNIYCAKRVLDFAEGVYTEKEVAAILGKRESKPPVGWPRSGEIVFEEVTVRYSPSTPVVLDRIGFHIRSGETIGLIGRSGDGKSTCMKALMRLCETESGKILIDGVDISTVPLEELRKTIVIIPQEPVIFTGTVRENLVDPEDEIDDSEIWRALHEVGMDELVDEMPKQLESFVGHCGDRFSVGERQLLCLARAILRKPTIVLLDEVNANLDLETDRKMQESIERVFSHCTRLTIAHRLAPLMKCDRIMLLKKGKILEIDTPYKLFFHPNDYPVFQHLVERSGDKEAIREVLLERGSEETLIQEFVVEDSEIREIRDGSDDDDEDELVEIVVEEIVLHVDSQKCNEAELRSWIAGTERGFRKGNQTSN